MDCTQWNESWVAYLYDECSDDERALVETHLASCDDCRERMDALREARQALGLAAPEIAVPSRVIVLPAARRRMSGLWGFAGGFAAAAALFVVGMFVGMNRVPTQQTILEPVETVALDSPDARDTGAAHDPSPEFGIQQVRNEYRELDARLGRVENWLPDSQGENSPRLATEDRLQVAVGNVYEQFDVRRQRDLQLFLQAFYDAELNARQRDVTYRQALEIMNAERHPNVRQR